MNKYIISFKNKSYVHIISVYAMLKDRYKGRHSVSFSSLKPQGGGLYAGYFKVV